MVTLSRTRIAATSSNGASISSANCSPSFTLTAGYVGSHGVHLPYHTDDINDVQPLPKLASGGYLWPTAAGSPRLFTSPTVQGQVSANTWSAVSTYHGLNVEALKRPSRGVQIQGSYTSSKSIDTSSSGIAGDTFGNSASSLPFFDSKLRPGLSDFDVRHTLAINALWQVPGPTSWSRGPRWTASGWQVGGIFTLTSGLPFTPTIGGDPLGLSSGDNYAFPDRTRGCNAVDANFNQDKLLYINAACFTLPMSTPAIAAQCQLFGINAKPPAPVAGTCANLLGNGGRNTVIGPGLQDMDFSLFKNNPIHRISETFNAQFRPAGLYRDGRNEHQRWFDIVHLHQFTADAVCVEVHLVDKCAPRMKGVGRTGEERRHRLSSYRRWKARFSG